MNFIASALRRPRGALRLWAALICRTTSGWGRTALLVWCLLPSAFCLFPGCSRHEPPADLVIINGAEPESIDPHINTGQPDGRIVDSLFEGLTRLDPRTARPGPGLAERWEISPDGRVYTFHLRSNAVWSTGAPITAHDVVFSWRRALAPETGSIYAGVLYYITNAEGYNAGWTNPVTGRLYAAEDVGVQAADDHTVRVELNNPTPFFLNLCSFRTYTVVPRQTIEQLGDRWMKARPLPVSGAYQLETWRVNNKIRVRKNPRYWDAPNTQSEVVDFLSTEQPNVALNLFVTGHADIIWDKNLVPTELFDLLRRRPDCHIYDYLGTYFFRFNVTQPPFHDMRVRQAFALALDKQRITDKITRGGEKPASHFTPDHIANYDPPEGLGFDPLEARRLLAVAGFPGGQGFPPVQYLMNTSRLNEQIGVEMQAMWQRELGLKVELRQVEWKVFLNDQSRTNYQMSRSSWVADYQDPNTFLDLFTSNNGNNRTGWSHARYDRLISDANAQTNAARRMELFREAETILVREEVPVVPLFFYVGVEFYDASRIQGIYPNSLAEHPLRAIRKIADR